MRWSFLLPLLIGAPTSFAAPQAAVPAPQADGAEVCVAVVANASTASAMTDRLTQRLISSLKQNKVRGVAMDSATTMQSQLRPTIENGEESKQKECDFILLTQISAKPLNPAEGQPEISIGGRVPSVDASDPLGGSSGPVYHQNVEIRFALFRTDRFDPDVEAVLLERPTSHATDSFMTGMDREANRIGKEWKKKSRNSSGDGKLSGHALTGPARRSMVPRCSLADPHRATGVCSDDLQNRKREFVDIVIFQVASPTDAAIYFAPESRRESRSGMETREV